MHKPSFINSFISFSVRATRQRLLLSTTKGSSKGRADRVAGGSSSRAAFLRLLALAKRVLHAVLRFFMPLLALYVTSFATTVDNESQFTATRLLMSMLLHQPRGPAANSDLRLCTKWEQREKFIRKTPANGGNVQFFISQVQLKNCNH